MERPAGVVDVVAGGRFATVATYQHDPAVAHRDPAEEMFDLTTVMLTDVGTWSMESALGRTRVDPSVVVIGTEGRAFRARHDADRPIDVTTFVELRTDPGVFGQEVEPLLARLEARQVAGRTREVARLDGALRTAALFPHSALRVDVLAIELLLAVADAPDPLPPARLHPDVRDRVLLARDHLDAHFEEDVTLADLARVAAVSPFHLTRLFRREVGLSPHAYLVERRLEAAAALLASGEASVTRVATDVGFSSPSHFTKRFRERFGVPPSRYRRLLG